MSYEGYVQAICKNGHYFTFCAVFCEEDPSCSKCGEEAVWINSVDDTNCESFGFIHMTRFETSPGHFRIPTPKEVERFRTYAYDNGVFYIETDERVPAFTWNPSDDSLENCQTLSSDNLQSIGLEFDFKLCTTIESVGHQP